MLEPRKTFDLALSFPQWQGSGRSAKLPRGADATAAVCGQFAPLVNVPLSDAAGGDHGVNRWAAIFGQFRSAREILEKYKPKRLLTAGGDCSVDVAVIDYLHGLYPDLTVVWVDAHLDANTPETSPSGNFHGMPVSAILGHAPEPMRRLMNPPIDPTRFFYAGIRAGDDGDWAFRQELGLQMLAPDALPSGPVHIHFDLDVLEPAEFPFLAYSEPNGLTIGGAVGLVSKIALAGNVVGLTITEFAPADAGEAWLGSKVIALLCEAVDGEYLS